ncbi:MAG: zinc-binding dehydrogenase [Candidatus Hodarchaeota archaeon]
MKALNLKFEKLIEAMQKVAQDPKNRPKVYELIDLEEMPELNLINEDWVKVKVKLGGICGTDLHILTLNISYALSSLTSYPAIFGHEFVGKIVEIGKNVKDFSLGDRVVIEPIIACQVRGLELCDSCKDGNTNLCCNLDQGNIAPGTWTGFCKDTGGGWGEYAVVHKSQLFKIPDSVSFEEAILIEPLAVAIHGIFRQLPKENENCVVIGCGTIGLSTIAALKLFSKCKVYAIAKYPFQSELAKKLGADEIFMIKRDMHIKKIGKTLGAKVISPMMEEVILLGGHVDIVIDTVGNASSLANAFRLIKYRGTVILVGIPAYEQIDWTVLIAKEATILPSMAYGNELFNLQKIRTFQLALDLISSGKVDLKEILTHKFKIRDYKEALTVALNKSENSSIKTVFSFE